MIVKQINKYAMPLVSMTKKWKLVGGGGGGIVIVLVPRAWESVLQGTVKRLAL